jgi:hypothetical protein
MFISLCYNCCDYWIRDLVGKHTNTCIELNNKLFQVPPLGTTYKLTDDYVFQIMSIVNVTTIPFNTYSILSEERWYWTDQIYFI